MGFLLLGLALVGLKLAGIQPVAVWPWWGVLVPFGLAMAWWTFADATGYYKRREMRKMEEKVAERRKRNVEALKPGRKSDRTR